MMSNGYYSIGLQRLKPVHTAYCGLHNLAENCVLGTRRKWPRPRRDVGTSRDRLETETSRPRPQPCFTDHRPSQRRVYTTGAICQSRP